MNRVSEREEETMDCEGNQKFLRPITSRTSLSGSEETSNKIVGSKYCVGGNESRTREHSSENFRVFGGAFAPPIRKDHHQLA